MADISGLDHKVVIFLEHRNDVFEYLEIRENIHGSHIVIATIPDVCWELEKKGVLYRGIEIYYDSDLIYSQGIKNYETVESICSKIDSVLQESKPELKKYSFKPAFDNFRFLKILFDNLTLRISIIHSIIEREKPDEIITFSSEKRSPSVQNMPFYTPFGLNESIFNILLGINSWNPEIKLLQRKNKSPVNKPAHNRCSLSSSFAGIFRQYRFIYRRVIAIKDFILNPNWNMLEFRYLKLINPICNKKTLFLFRDEPSWIPMNGALYRHGYHVVNLSEITESFSQESDFDITINKQLVEIFRDVCVYRGIDFSQIFEERFFPVLEKYFSYAPEIVQNLKLKIDKYKPVAFLSSEKAFFYEHMYAHIAQSRNIPVIAWQHGDGPFYPPMQIFIEIRDSDVHMSYGPGHQVMLREAPHNHFNSRIESVGSLILEKIYQKNTTIKHENKILYVTAQFYYSNLNVNNYPIPDNTQWHYQKTILNLLGNSQVPTIFKLMPQEYETPLFSEYINENGFTNISLIHFERSFVELLNEADIVICDYPSTPVIEAIAAHKTIFVLLASPHLRTEALTLLKKRVYWSDDVEEFVKLISDYMKGIDVKQSPDMENIEYLEMYGVHKLDGNVSKRALEIIENEVKARS
ncbi:MAG: hypothetical protein CVV30_03015 [Methanomicrobiales archaeon HGW-Methanomicrobiales-1]|jgi:hypothetical protein|nr:MAG: hypothetical protein CVV30_03015 [Methanomicrobiales archaeon HGW-Methanomicrobiales-1]